MALTAIAQRQNQYGDSMGFSSIEDRDSWIRDTVRNAGDAIRDTSMEKDLNTMKGLGRVAAAFNPIGRGVMLASDLYSLYHDTTSEIGRVSAVSDDLSLKATQAVNAGIDAAHPYLSMFGLPVPPKQDFTGPTDYYGTYKKLPDGTIPRIAKEVPGVARQYFKQRYNDTRNQRRDASRLSGIGASLYGLARSYPPAAVAGSLLSTHSRGMEPGKLDAFGLNSVYRGKQ